MKELDKHYSDWENKTRENNILASNAKSDNKFETRNTVLIHNLIKIECQFYCLPKGANLNKN